MAVPIEELTCLQCGYLLFGLTSERCPECGGKIDWEAALEDFRRRQKPLFEYHWRKEPIRSFLRSVWLAVRPWRLWRIVDIHDPPNRAALRGMLAIAAVIFALSVPLTLWAAELVTAMLVPGAGFWGGGAFLPPLRWGLGWYGMLLLFIAAWCAGGYGALLLLRQSMGRCRVNNGHVLRAYCYAMLPVAAGGILWCAVGLALETADAMMASPIWGRAPSLSLDAGRALLGALPFVIWFWVFMSIALAYRLYIRMKHAWWVALATQVIALLFSFTVVSVLNTWLNS